MRGEDDIGERPELVVRRERFRAKDIQSGPGDFSRFQSGNEVRLVDNLAAGTVHDPHAGLHLGDRFGVDHAPRVWCHRHVDGDEIRGAVDGIGVSDEFDSQLAGTGFGEEGVVGDDSHSEGESPFGDFRTNAAHAQYAEGLSVNLYSLERLTVPLARGHGGVGGGDLSGDGTQHEEG